MGLTESREQEYFRATNEADAIVNHRSQEKDRQYGPFSEGMIKAALHASELRHKEITADDMFAAMIGLKVSRESYNHKYDNILDSIAYALAWDNYTREYSYMNTKYKLYHDLQTKGAARFVRGENMKELLNYSFTLPAYDRFIYFSGRPYTIKYLKKEMLWYLTGDKKNQSICVGNKKWQELVNEDGSINSNYGQYINEYNVARTNAERIIETLRADKHSRQAIISIGNNDNYNSDTKDYCCCQYIGFVIRDNKFMMNVRFRSSDIIFGITNDVATMSMYQEIIYVMLRDTCYRDLELGQMHFATDNLHAYEKHFEMVANVVELKTEREVDDCPRIKNYDEAHNLLRGVDDFSDFSNWLHNR